MLLAKVSKEENIPFFVLKYISDGADGGAAEDLEQVKFVSAFQGYSILIENKIESKK